MLQLGALKLPDLHDGSRRPLFQDDGSLRYLPPGAAFLIKPYGTKNRQEANTGTIVCAVTGEHRPGGRAVVSNKQRAMFVWFYSGFLTMPEPLHAEDMVISPIYGAPCPA